MSQLKIGDVVSLKSGGPAMTIENIGNYGSLNPGIYCIWFDSSKKLESLFHPDTLRLVDDSNLSDN